MHRFTRRRRYSAENTKDNVYDFLEKCWAIEKIKMSFLESKRDPEVISSRAPQNVNGAMLAAENSQVSEF